MIDVEALPPDVMEHLAPVRPEAFEELTDGLFPF
jgi:hypothetical protein